MSAAARVVVVGGGIVGLATAHRLLEARPDLDVTVVEAEDEVGLQQSSHNSGVAHAGLYYPPGSVKAKLCVEGRSEMERFCADHGVPFTRFGKVVVAVRESELPRLAALGERARQNGVEVEELDAAGVAAHEPHVTALAGLWSPATGGTDFGLVCKALAREIERVGGSVRTSTRVENIEELDSEVRVVTSAGDLTADAVVACTGLEADRFAGLAARPAAPRIVPFRGSWLQLRPDMTHLVNSNIYPVPAPGLPFLGVHLTRRIDGQVWVGPNAVLSPARHGVRPWQVHRRDLASSVLYPGLWRLGVANASVAAGEVWRDRVMRAMVREIQRYVPAIERKHLRRGPWGVRAQLVTHDGKLVDDFVFDDSRRVVHVLNAPSPAATASLAIGRVLRDRVFDRLT